MAKYSKTEQQALFSALEKLHEDNDQPYYLHICNLYDKLTGVKYANFKSTYDFMKCKFDQQKKAIEV